MPLSSSMEVYSLASMLSDKYFKDHLPRFEHIYCEEVRRYQPIASLTSVKSIQFSDSAKFSIFVYSIVRRYSTQVLMQVEPEDLVHLQEVLRYATDLLGIRLRPHVSANYV